MRYSIELRERRPVKGYGFLSFAKNIDTHATKVAKNMSNKYGQKLADTAKKSATDAIKTASMLIRLRVHKKPRVMKNHHYQLRLIIKYQKKDIYLQRKGNKLLMN